MEQNPAVAEELMPVAASLEAAIANLKRERLETGQRLRILENNQQTLHLHVAAIENSLIFRFLRTIGKPLLEWKARLAARLHRSGSPDPVYESWFQQRPRETDPHELARQPLFSLVLQLHQPDRAFLTQTVDSVLRQTYPNWELCVYTAESGDLPSDPRIRVCDGPPGSAERGDYVAFLQQHDVLSPAALRSVAQALQDGPADLIYTDEDRLNAEGRHVEPVFKPDWSPELLLSMPYTGHLMVYSREALDRTGSARSGFEGAEDYDLALRLSDGPAKIVHVPQVLYHARMRAEPAATSAAARRALEDALRRRNCSATVEAGSSPGRYRIRWNPARQPLVSLIICSRSPKLLAKCLEGIRGKTAYAPRECVVVQHVTGVNDAAMDKVIEQHGAKSVRYAGPFHFSRMNNLAAQSAAGEILVFFNDDVEPLVDSWLTDLVGQVQRPEIGVAGARLLYPSGALQHAGITIGIGDGCGHAGRGTFHARYWPWLDVTRDVSAVTGACLAVRRQVFEEAGGFSERFPVNYNDADLCLKIVRAGYRNVYVSTAVLRHDECQTRAGGVTLSERQQWYSCWPDELDRGDPFYSPNLTRTAEDVSLRTAM